MIKKLKELEKRIEKLEEKVSDHAREIIKLRKERGSENNQADQSKNEGNYNLGCSYPGGIETVCVKEEDE